MRSINRSNQDEPGESRTKGRPRDTRIDDAVLRATVELLEEIGYTRLTIPLVAARAGAMRTERVSTSDGSRIKTPNLSL